ncbi:hypothetical protein UFOVP1339_38 [uncultured Caudovirales phage]|uniref:Uncharacterized protein n=1 Tax=uncultured Caudovirales phage TaxID=2100421 RepID=A0A6J5S1J5_9CAUD|nr:hypothetical protein UFOVP1339_38 [uncultured Caudovirales phage]
MATKLTREEWLIRCAAALSPHFKKAGYTLPKNIRMTCGLPSKGGFSQKKRTIGQCWPISASADKTIEIFISPTQDQPLEIAAILAHELVHATVGNKEKHGKVFKACALAIGLEGKMTATSAGPDFVAWFKGAAKGMGKYHHAKMDYSKMPKQTTRMLKCSCPECESDGTPYIVRLSQSTLDRGAPICPVHEIEMAAA